MQTRYLKQAKSFSLVAAAMLYANTAMAHHVMDGETPETAMQGLLSGFAHPVIGWDHLLFIIGVGLFAGLHKRAFMLPVLYLGGMFAGLVAMLSGLTSPMAETLVALSMIIVGLCVVRYRAVPWFAAAILFAGLGTFHGYAFGGGIVGAEQSPILAYLAGLMAVQYAICAGSVAVTRALIGGTLPILPARAAGALIASAGVFLTATSLGVA